MDLITLEDDLSFACFHPLYIHIKSRFIWESTKVMHKALQPTRQQFLFLPNRVRLQRKLKFPLLLIQLQKTSIQEVNFHTVSRHCRVGFRLLNLLGFLQRSY